MRRPVGYGDLNELCRGITTSFVHLETRDSYGTEVELPYLAKWRRHEADDFAWLTWWLDMLRGHRVAGRSCRRARVVSEPVSDYQMWAMSHAPLFVDAGEEMRYVSRPRLTDVQLPGSGDFYIFDDALVLFLHYAGSGINVSFETCDDTRTIQACRRAFGDVWRLATPFSAYRPD